MMDNPGKLMAAKKKPKSGKLYGCPQCSYKANRAYNVQRHLVKHFEKPPKELQHICQIAGCSFSTLRWDNLSRHMQRVHGVTKSRNEEAKKNNKIDRMDEDVADDENPASDKDPTCDEDTADDEDTALMPSDVELASLLGDEIPAKLPAEKPPETFPTKPNKESKQNRIVKPRKNYKSGKSKYYECTTCSYRTNRCYNIKRHIAKHMIKQGSTAELVLHVCVIAGCGFSTPRWDNLCRHVKKIHPESAEPAAENL